jgi:hypothetical protein
MVGSKVKRLFIVLAIVVVAFDTFISIGVLLAYLGFCHAGLTVGPPFNGFGRC